MSRATNLRTARLKKGELSDHLSVRAALVQADPNRIGQVFSNLLDNA